MLIQARQIDGRREFMPKAELSREGAIGGANPFSFCLLKAFWVLAVSEIEWFVFAITGAPVYYLPTLIAPVLIVLLAFNFRDRRVLYWPLILFVLLHVGASAVAENAGLSRGALKTMLYMMVLFSASAWLLDRPSKVITVLKIYLIGFGWFGIFGIPTGRVFWHPLLANEDSYGPLMVISIAFSYFLALATSTPRWKFTARCIFALSLLGLMCSFARGAAVAFVVVLVYILILSPHRFRTLTAVILTLVLVLPLAASFFPLDSYMAEIKSSASGDDGRKAVWQLAWKVFLESPIYGVGAYNFGPVASRIADWDDVRGIWNGPENLYFWGVHNAAMQILAEEGIIGVTLWISMIIGFFRRVRRIRAKEAIARWSNCGGNEWDLRMIAFGLEASMVGYLATSPFYNQIYIHWFWSLITIAYVLGRLTSPGHVASQRAT
jgi:O-antigen ligase